MACSVALAGIHGKLGFVTLAALLSPQFSAYFKKPIRILSTNTGQGLPFGKVVYAPVDYNDPETFEEPLRDVDVLINLLGYAPTVWDTLAGAAYRAGVRLYIPSEFGPDSRLSQADPILAAKRLHADNARNHWRLKTVQIFCGIFMETAIPSGEWFGINLPVGRVEAVLPRGRPEPRISFTAIADVGMAIAGVARYRPEDLPDTMRIAGDTLSIGEITDLWTEITRRPVQFHPVDLASFRQIANSSPSSMTRLTAAEGYLDFSASSHNEWVNAGGRVWQWTTIAKSISAEQPTADITAHTSMPETRAARRRREAEVMRRAQRAISQLHHSQQHEEALDEGGPAQLDSTPPVERVRGRIRTRVSRGGPASRDLRRNRGRA